MSSTCMSHAHAICAMAVSLPASIAALQRVAKARRMSHSCRCEILTALGRPVEPEVKIMYASDLSARKGDGGVGVQLLGTIEGAHTHWLARRS